MGNRFLRSTRECLNQAYSPSRYVTSNLRLGRGGELQVADSWHRSSPTVLAPFSIFRGPPNLRVQHPSPPTPNASVISVYGSDSIWVSGVFEKLTSTLREGRVGTGWAGLGIYI